MRRWAVAAVTVAVLLVVAAVVGARQPGGFVVLGWFDRPILFGVIALGLLALACWLVMPTIVGRLVSAGLLVVLALGWAMLGWFASGMSVELRELSRHPSAEGARVLILYRGANVIDPTWELRLRSGNGLGAREWDLGCVNSDVDQLTGLEWTGADLVSVHLSRRGSVDIVLDSATGRPAAPVSVGC